MKFCHLQHGWAWEDILLSEISHTEKDKYCVIYQLHVESKKINKLVNIIRTTMTKLDIYVETIRGYQWREGRRKGQVRGKAKATMYKIRKGYFVHHREFSQYFIMIINI